MSTISRQEIINKYKSTLEPLEYVYAMWLEGSDANGQLDEYSDIDINIDVADEYEAEVFKLIESLFEYDSIYDTSGNSKQKQRIYHIKETSEYLMIDFNLQPHSCNSENSTFVYNDEIDVNLTLFDKANVIKYVELNPKWYAKEHQYWFKESKYRFSQLCRVRKYTLRNEYPEAFIYYNKYVVEPIVMLLRIKYTPAKVNYHMIHISRHIPKNELQKLNRLLQVSNVDDIANNLDYAVKWYNCLKM